MKITGFLCNTAVLGTALCLTSLAWAGDAAATADLYKTTCQKCHGADGRGDTPAGKKFEARDFHSPDVQKMTDAELIKITSEGQKKMPSYKDKLTQDQIKDLVAYVRQLGKTK
jgi:mono/diheme cytochrome c family protein